MNKVVVEAPAKLNLALAVTGLRADGYHTVDMLMQAVSVYERVEIAKSMGYSLRLPKSPVPANDKNTATKAAAAFFWHTGLLAGADITIHKTVPTRAGMAGGSANAAAVLVGLNALYGARLTLTELCAIGAQVGADVPFALLGGTARACGVGEALTPLPPLAGAWFCIAMPPGAGVSTPMAYQRFDAVGSPLRPDLNAAAEAVKAGSLRALAPHMQNMLEYAGGDETTAALRKALDGAGALASMMTGSGAAVFGLFAGEDAARAAAKAVRPYAARVFVAQGVPHGPQIVSH